MSAGSKEQFLLLLSHTAACLEETGAVTTASSKHRGSSVCSTVAPVTIACPYGTHVVALEETRGHQHLKWGRENGYPLNRRQHVLRLRVTATAPDGCMKRTESTLTLSLQ